MKEFNQGVHHIALTTPDMEKSVRFYCDLLGFETVERFYDENEESEIVFLSLGNVLLELLAPSTLKEFGCSSSFHIAFAVSDVRLIYETLKAQGVHFSLPPTDSHGFRYAYFSGPMGEILEIMQRV